MRGASYQLTVALRPHPEATGGLHEEYSMAQGDAHAVRRHDVEKAAVAASVPPIPRAVLGAMTRMATGKGGELRDAFACYARVATETGYSERSVRRAVGWLRDAGWLHDTGRTHGRTQRIRVYDVRVPVGVTGGPNAAREAGSNAAREAARGNKSLRDRDLNVDSDRVAAQEVSMATQQGLFGGTEEHVDIEAQWDDAMALWHQLAREAGRRVGTAPRTGPIGKALRARLREHGPEAVARVMRWFWRSKRADWWREHTEFATVMRPSQFPRLLDKAAGDPMADAAWSPPLPEVKPGGLLATRRAKGKTSGVRRGE